MSIIIQTMLETKLIIFILVYPGISLGIECPSSWFDCGNGRCISPMWVCEGENDCGNLRDEENCENRVIRSLCHSNQFKCQSNKHCIPETWRCDGEKDCDDGSDEMQCDNKLCPGYRCPNHYCIPDEWRCDGQSDCPDESDEEQCPSAKFCADFEFLCSTGSCINRSLVCDASPDCTDGSDEGFHCGDSCKDANCSQNCQSTPSGPQCYCEDGYMLDRNDNKTCLDINECMKDGICSHKCVNTIGSFKCSCLEGYELSNKTCKVKGADPLLIFSTSQEIRGMRLRSGQYFPVRNAFYRASAVDVDPNSQRIYWVEISNRSAIYSVNLDGSGFRMILSHGLLIPEGIAMDYISHKLYVTDSGLRQVLVCTISGSKCYVLHDKVEKPRSMVLDLTRGFLYWSFWDEQTSGIYRSGMDGSSPTSLVSDRTAMPSGIAIDHALNRLYWADAKLNTIEFITLDGTYRKVILNSPVFHPYSLAVFEDAIYWSDWSTFSLESCNKFTGHKMTLLTRENGEHITGVHIYHPTITAKVINPCWFNDCSHMCLISPTKGFSCACPHGFQLSPDEKSCAIKGDSDSIFVNEGSSVFYIHPEAIGSETVTELPLQLNSAVITRVSYDIRSRSLFVADVNAPAIHAINVTSLHMRKIVKNHMISPEDLSFDWISRNLYWIDSIKGTAEVISTENFKRIILLKDLSEPVALAITPTRGYMFIATMGIEASVSMYDMSGKNKRILNAIQGSPISVALHPSKSVLFWADPVTRSISYTNYLNSSPAKTLMSRLDGVTSVASSEDGGVYWTAKKRELNLLKGNVTFTLQLPGQDKRDVSRKVTYAVRPHFTEKSVCLVANGGCGYLCLTSPGGRICVCPPDMELAKNGSTCMERRCDPRDFRCMNNGRCLPSNLRCDGSPDCNDGSDEVGCGNRCTGDDFQCRNGRCILKSWRCDHRNDCTDNSDEEDCPKITTCTKDQVSCSDGECISTIWRCDGEADCADGSDEIKCNETRCPDSQVRCDTGQCVPISWVCDNSNDCYDGSDEKNCESQVACAEGMYTCRDGICIYHDQVCDGHNDCSENEDEINCTCHSDELFCPSSKRCIPLHKMCDGVADCSDGTDENNCDQDTKQSEIETSKTSATECEGFYCYNPAQCLPWSKVCDGRRDCSDLPDEGGLCSRSCSLDNGGCSQICQRSPRGLQCSCYKGYRLLLDNKTCDDIDECLDPRTCSHFCNNTKGGFKCSCARGFSLHHDHRHCKAEEGPGNMVYLLSDQIRGFDLVSQKKFMYINMSSKADMRGIDYDASEALFYWTDYNDGSINSYSPDTHRQDIIIRLSSSPIYVRYDWIEKNLYYTDANSDIGVCTKDGRYCRILMQFVTPIDSLDISPTTREMFWTVWATHRKQISGLIEKAEIDGSQKRTIIKEKTLKPTAITVDHLLKMIYWTDVELNTLECANFDGSKRRQVVQYPMEYAYAMTIFEDHVYWSDWGTNSIIRCEKFSSDEASCTTTLRERYLKVLFLMVINKVLHPEGISRCMNSNCPQICLPTVFDGHVCVCGDGFVERYGTCVSKSTPTHPATPVKCPDHHCLADAECVVKNGNYICNCPPEYTGRKCELKRVKPLKKTYDYSWIAFFFMAVLILGVLVLIVLLCTEYREKFQETSDEKAKKAKKFQCQKTDHWGRPVLEPNEDYDHHVIRQIRKYRRSLKNAFYTLVNTEESIFKESQIYSCETQTLTSGFMSIFRKQKGFVSQVPH